MTTNPGTDGFKVTKKEKLFAVLVLVSEHSQVSD